MGSRFDQAEASNILLGLNQKEPTQTGFRIRIEETLEREIRTGSEGHLMTFAPTGSGKTWTLAIPTLMDYTGSVVAFDPKGELALATAGTRQAMGQEVIILDPFEITGFVSASLNPIHLMLDAEPTLENAQCLAASIVNETSGMDPFWDVSARNLVSQLLLFIAHDSPKALRDLHELSYLLNQSLKDMHLTLRDMARSKAGTVSSAAYSLPVEADRTVACILATARRFTEIYRSDVIRGVTSKTSFPIEILESETPTTIYLVLPPAYLRTHSGLIRVWMETLIARRIRKDPDPERQTLFLIDEAAQLGQMEFLITSVTLLRSYGVRCWTFWQDPQQLQACYPVDWQTLFNNSQYHTVFGRQSFIASKGLETLYGRMGADLINNGFFVELGEAPRAFRRPSVKEVLARVSASAQYVPAEQLKKKSSGAR
ncbi:MULTISPECIES: type IV secretory system conjugative DNA transfer family protein [unclassified Ruegeria]|uniref:type IV secretory system conjugative DNA transfer family protein n=1 Tax=unclassified Ruegeria TaxID=2625375 RepID=UPI0014893D0B|nr:MULTISPECIES: type IV secretory system conjugative DNA transfer family protein [unclassified Ruegeria]NOD62112.1 type IV secretory system conjugative DNA transfer family protein [Ruegeria sp. HKCCD6109]